MSDKVSWFMQVLGWLCPVWSWVLRQAICRREGHRFYHHGSSWNWCDRCYFSVGEEGEAED